MNRHALDPVSLISGLVFATVAGIYLAEQHTSLDVDGRWVLPLALIGLGIGGVLGAIARANQLRRIASDPMVNEGDAGEPTGPPESTEVTQAR